MKKKFAIGIDPDIEELGVAGYDCEEREFETVSTMNFWETTDYIKLKNIQYGKNLVVRISAGWLIDKTMWHKPHANNNIQNKISMNVGMNHASGKLIAQFCERLSVDYELIKPSGKVDAKTFKNITKYPFRTNQDVRDAGMLVFM